MSHIGDIQDVIHPFVAILQAKQILDTPALPGQSEEDRKFNNSIKAMKLAGLAIEAALSIPTYVKASKKLKRRSINNSKRINMLTQTPGLIVFAGCHNLVLITDFAKFTHFEILENKTGVTLYYLAYITLQN